MNDLELIKKYVPNNLVNEAIKKLNEGIPVQYIIGNVYFYNSVILVNENVLIPRFETEYLIEKTINYLKKINKNNYNILEVGTGSGCISIALKKELSCNILAIDINEEAIILAKENAIKNDTVINFKIEDIHNYKDNNKYDLIISNPPYVPYNSEVDKKIKYEPQNAIYAKDNGVYFYKIILEKVKNNLNNDYLIAFEIGDKEGILIKDIVNSILPNAYVKIEKDYNNYERYIFITNKKEIFNI